MTILGIVSSQQELAPSNPVSGYYVWFDASDASSITSSGGYVSQWNDKSGNSFHVTNGGGSSVQPQTGANTMNGKNVLTWNDTGSLRGLRTSIPGALVGNPNVTVYAVARYNSGGNWGLAAPFSFGEDQGSPTGIISFPTLAFKAAGDTWSGANGTNITNSTDIRDQNHIYSIKKSSSTITSYRDGTSLGTASGSWSIGNNAMVVGYLPQGGGGNWSWNGYVAEILVYNSALSSTDDATNIAYLKAKWGIA
jgi:hypothetical protein